MNSMKQFQKLATQKAKSMLMWLKLWHVKVIFTVSLVNKEEIFAFDNHLLAVERE